MKKIIFLIAFAFFFGSLFADWDIGDEHKMHFPQLPDPTGWDVNFTYDGASHILADDWQCSITVQISFIHLWFSVQGDQEIYIAAVEVTIHADNSGLPGTILWSRIFYDSEFSIRDYGSGEQGWFDPIQGTHNHPDHYQYYQLNIENISEPFVQTEGVTYWLSIQVQTETGTAGWKTSQDHFRQAAVYWDQGTWQPLHDPIQGDTDLDLAFVVSDLDEPLPVELSSFNAIYSGRSTLLNWSTQSETDNVGWNIYRSETDSFIDGLLITEEMIDGAGTTAEPTDYSYSDQFAAQENSTYYYWLQSTSLTGTTELYGPIAVDIKEQPDNPTPPSNIIAGLHQNYPNPFNPETNIVFAVEEPGNAELKVYNVKGQEVVTLYCNHADADEYVTVKWDGKDYNQNDVASGVYTYILKTTKNEYTKRMILLK